MFPRRDAYGTTQLFKPFRAHEPDPRSVEAVHQVPRQANKHLTASSQIISTSREVTDANPSKITSAHTYSAKSPRKRRQLPPTPSKQALHSRIQSHKVPYYDKTRPVESASTNRSTFVAPEPTREYECSDRTIQPLSQNVQRSSFREDMIARSGDTTGKWNTGHGYSEREPVGSLPLTMVGENGEQVSAWRRSKEFIESLRVPDDKAPDPWWTPHSSKPASRNEQQRTLSESDDLPDVFVRLTDHKRYNSTHKHRFSQDGVGLGLEGRREDEGHRVVLAGKAKITREADPEMDAPNKPALPWETPKTSRPVSRSSGASSRRNSSKDSVFERLAQPNKRKDVPDGDYEIKMKVMNDYGVNKDLVAKWQVS